jgi:NAD(P)-dependent dehydrogenase (short-subunit alcohol dehydrogenase family)
MLLKDKVVIISGIGPGLGVKLAVEAARYGAAALAISARTAEKLDDAERLIHEVNAQCGLQASRGSDPVAVRPDRRPGQQRVLLGCAGDGRLVGPQGLARGRRD